MSQYGNIGNYSQTHDVKYYAIAGDKNTLFTGSRVKTESSQVQQILLELQLTDYLQNELDRCNLCLKNFKLRLIMEED
jgi:hypothetical protein